MKWGQIVAGRVVTAYFLTEVYLQVTYKYSNLNLGLGIDRTGILIAWSEYHSNMVSVSEALRKWDQLAPSVLDIYYEFMYNYVTILIDVWMSGIEINFFKIKK